MLFALFAVAGCVSELEPDVPLVGQCTPLGSDYCDPSAVTCTGPLDSWFATSDRTWVCASREDCDAAARRFVASACDAPATFEG